CWDRSQPVVARSGVRKCPLLRRFWGLSGHRSAITEGRVLINAQMSGFGGEAEILCSTRALLVLTVKQTCRGRQERVDQTLMDPLRSKRAEVPHRSTLLCFRVSGQPDRLSHLRC